MFEILTGILDVKRVEFSAIMLLTEDEVDWVDIVLSYSYVTYLAVAKDSSATLTHTIVELKLYYLLFG